MTFDIFVIFHDFSMIFHDHKFFHDFPWLSMTVGTLHLDFKLQRIKTTRNIYSNIYIKQWESRRESREIYFSTFSTIIISSSLQTTNHIYVWQFSRVIPNNGECPERILMALPLVELPMSSIPWFCTSRHKFTFLHSGFWHTKTLTWGSMMAANWQAGHL